MAPEVCGSLKSQSIWQTSKTLLFVPKNLLQNDIFSRWESSERPAVIGKLSIARKPGSLFFTI